MATVTETNGHVREVKNLRWLLEHAGKEGVAELSLEDVDAQAGMHFRPRGSGRLTATMADGAKFVSDFASFVVMLRWVHRPTMEGVVLIVRTGTTSMRARVERPMCQQVAGLLDQHEHALRGAQ